MSNVASDYTDPRFALAWRSILVVAFARFALPAASAWFAPIGYTPDEFYYLECARHLDWGFVDHPPFSIALLGLIDLVIGDSIFALRLIPAICEAFAVIATAALARELGGGPRAQSIAATAVAAAPIALVIGLPYSMNPIEHLLWPLVALVLAKLQNGANPRWWIVAGALLGVALENKLSTLWFGGAIGAGLLLAPARVRLATRWPWLAVAVALALLAPHLVWQVANDWPTIEFIRNNALAREGLDAAVVIESPLIFVASQVFLMGPLAAPIWIVGLFALLRSPSMSNHRALGWSFAALFAFMALSGRGNAYYLVAAFPIAFAAGGVAIERVTQNRTGIIAWLALGSLGLQAALVAPFVIPLVGSDQYLETARSVRHALGADVGSASLPPTYQWMQGGPEVASAVQSASETLRENERERVGVLATTFGDAGALAHFSDELDLPPVIGTHNNFWRWGHADLDGGVMIVVAASDSVLLTRFGSCEPAATVDCPHCEPHLRDRPIFVCRGPRSPLSTMWSELKDYS